MNLKKILFWIVASCIYFLSCCWIFTIFSPRALTQKDFLKSKYAKAVLFEYTEKENDTIFLPKNLSKTVDICGTTYFISTGHYQVPHPYVFTKVLTENIDTLLKVELLYLEVAELVKNRCDLKLYGLMTQLNEEYRVLLGQFIHKGVKLDTEYRVYPEIDPPKEVIQELLNEMMLCIEVSELQII